MKTDGKGKQKVEIPERRRIDGSNLSGGEEKRSVKEEKTTYSHRYSASYLRRSRKDDRKGRNTLVFSSQGRGQRLESFHRLCGLFFPPSLPL